MGKIEEITMWEKTDFDFLYKCEIDNEVTLYAVVQFYRDYPNEKKRVEAITIYQRQKRPEKLDKDKSYPDACLEVIPSNVIKDALMNNTERGQKKATAILTLLRDLKKLDPELDFREVRLL